MKLYGKFSNSCLEYWSNQKLYSVLIIEVDFILEYVFAPPSISQTKRKDFRKIVKRLSKNFGWCLLNLYEIWMKLFGSFLSVFLLNRGEFYFYSSLHWTVRKVLTRFVILNIIHWNEFTFPLLFIESITHLTIIRELIFKYIRIQIEGVK